MFTLKEIESYEFFESLPVPSLSTLCAKACVLYSEHLLGQLERVVLPVSVARLLVETYQQMGRYSLGAHARFLAALKDWSGTSPWVFPGDPIVLPDTSAGPLTTVCLQYAQGINDSLLAEIKKHEKRITGLVCSLTVSKSVVLSQLRKLVTDKFEYVIPTDQLVHLQLHQFNRDHMKKFQDFSNLEWLAISCGEEYEPNYMMIVRHDISPLFALRKLKHLELQGYGSIKHAKQTFTEILTVMPELEYIDISETDLDEGGLRGLFELRSSRPLKFIGLYKTTYNGCLLKNIPAEVVSGTANGQQRAAVLETWHSYWHPKEIMYQVPDHATRNNYYVQLLQLLTKKHIFMEKLAFNLSQEGYAFCRPLTPMVRVML